MTESSEIIRALLCGLFCIGGACALAVGIGALLWVNRKRRQRLDAVSPEWLATTGRITGTSIEEAVRTQVGEDILYYPAVTFEYTVAGQVYAGKQAVGRPHNMTFRAKRALEKYPVGAAVPVTYNPQAPSEARLVVT